MTSDTAFRKSLAAVRSLVVLTGAGMSAECGIPVFRGPGGLWEGHRPEDLATPDAFARDPDRVWRWYRWRLERVLAAQPHAGYTALASLEERFPGGVEIITQNVDGLHERAGSRQVVELHGSILWARCTLDCGAGKPLQDVDPGESCNCGKGRWRPGVVWFGEGLDPDVLDRAEDALNRADMVWVVGTSSVVYPAAALPRLAASRGVRVVEINPEPTPLSEMADVTLRDPASNALVRLVELMKRSSV